MAAVIAFILTVSIPARAETISKVLVPLDKEIYSVILPVLSEEGPSPFDFIMDPQNLIYLTNAAAYGGGKVEEGVNLLFHNHEGDYDFSSFSDRLKVYNRSTVPVAVTISARISNLGDIELVDSPDFTEGSGCRLYMALTDDEGHEIPLVEGEEVSRTIEMREAPDNAYCYRIDENTGTYEYTLSTDPENIDFDSYSFGLVGGCSADGDWWSISARPKVEVTWKVEPLEDESADGEEELQEDIGDEDAKKIDEDMDDAYSVSDNSLQEEAGDSEELEELQESDKHPDDETDSIFEDEDDDDLSPIEDEDDAGSDENGSIWN